MISDSLGKKDIVELLPGKDEICFVVKSAFSKRECEELLWQANRTGFRAASDKYPESYRNNERLEVDNAFLASCLFDKIRPIIPEKLKSNEKSYILSSLNGRLRYCKYAAGQSFSIHQDGIYYPSINEESVLTFLLYLNDSCDYEGGKTLFFDGKAGNTKLAEYSGKAGDVIVFDHKLWHSGQTVTENNKYILRSDLIYTVTEKYGVKHTHHDGYIWKLINLPGSRIASASRDRSIKIWNSTMTEEQILINHENSVFDMTFSDDFLFAVSRDGFLSIWREGAQGYELIDKVNTNHRAALSVAVSGNSIVTCGSDGYVRSWSKSGELISSRQVTHGWVWKVLSVSDERLLVCTSEGEVQLLAITDLKTIERVKISCAARCADLSSQYIYMGDECGIIYQLDINTLNILKFWSVHCGIIRDVSSRGAKVYSCGEDGKVICFDLESEEITEIYCDKSFVTSLCWANNQKLLFSSYTGRIEMHGL